MPHRSNTLSQQKREIPGLRIGLTWTYICQGDSSLAQQVCQKCQLGKPTKEAGFVSLRLMGETMLDDILQASAGAYDFALGAGWHGRKLAAVSCTGGDVDHFLDAWHALEAHVAKMPNVNLPEQVAVQLQAGRHGKVSSNGQAPSLMGTSNLTLAAQRLGML